MTRLLYVLATIVILGYLTWPFGTLLRFYLALKASDVMAIKSLVDWSSVRSNIADDLKPIAERLLNKKLGSSDRPEIKIDVSYMSNALANAIAAELGVTSGMAVSTALERLAQAPEPQGQLAPVGEARHQVMLESSSAAIWLLDSASLVKPEDEGETIITGSHGGLIGGDPSRALKAKAKIVVFNSAGVGIEGIGITRLPALDKRGVAAVAVDCHTARIGDAASALDTGIISHANQTAMNLAAAQGLALKAWLENCT